MERKYVCYDRRFLSTGLDVSNMILLTEIENLSKLENGCYATDKQLGELIQIGRCKTNERIKYIETFGYIKCITKYINGKRRRVILFLFDKVEFPQGNPRKRMRKSKVELPQSNPNALPQGNNNKLYKELNPNILNIENGKEIPARGSDNKKETQPEKTGPSILGKKSGEVSFIITEEVNSIQDEKKSIPTSRNDLNYNERRRIEYEGMLLSSYYNKLTDIQQIEFFQLDYDNKLELATKNHIPTEEFSTIGN